MGIIDAAAVCEPAQPPLVRRIEQDGRVTELLPIVLKNMVLKLLTLGVYQFWATTRIRRYLWSRASFDGDPIEWAGTGKELFKGFVAVVLFILLPMYLVNLEAQHLIQNGHPGIGGPVAVVLGLLYMSLVPLGLYRARRYRLSRTVWRGIHGTQGGEAWRYALRWWGWNLLMPLTLGLVLPLRDVSLMRYKLKHTVFGDRNFQFAARASVLYRRFLLCYAVVEVLFILIFISFSLDNSVFFKSDIYISQNQEIFVILFAASLLIVFLITLPVIFAAYQAAVIRHFAATMRWGDLAFRSTITTWAVLKLIIPNFLIVLFTFGFGLPFAQLRRARAISHYLEIVGDQDFATVLQNQAPVPTAGEGLVAMFDGVDI